ncbi:MULTISPECIES: molybdopterin cofactor-binding domain-containing protein [unclassified Marinobacter]|uniref:xanthine dehydrogenase family protein molybdopterin-binding subunit n=1 Tax=unclassified Marinobacter TaxID=83889 RepID=UPI00200C6E8A|nr:MULTISPECIES: molybdopterin cofactor-binding domain-containing protein [unclassified Marinobacter]UQG54909.1 molybdopterin-dependent oxidoreductase [Marinobacter sp. M4C]UQG63710.1 molybdopterin-dependent oxidoreductase [Marinobacter sp. M2C]UQG67993.1 molybdopterin-dependent oxidoreductase [Marinobacter sp. M1C]
MTQHSNFSMTRRWFLALAGAGVTTGVLSTLAFARAPVGQAMGEGFQPTVWYAIAADGKITMHIHMAEMGQHVGTALSRIIAEELEADWDDVEFVHVDTDPKWGYMITGGSWSVNHNFFAFSRAGAAGRMALIEAGAREMGVPAAECIARKSKVIHGKQSISYGELVARGSVDRQFSKEELKAIELKPAYERRLLNRDTVARDVPAKVDGSAIYGIDRTIDGMVYARPVMPPVRFGSRVTNWDDTAAKAVPGYIQTVEINDPTNTCQGWLVVVAESWTAASKAVDLLNVTWEGGSGKDTNEADLLAEGERLVNDNTAGSLFVLEGEPDAVLDTAEKVHEGLYQTHTVLHMQLEPGNALVWQDGDTWRVHAGNQWQSLTLPLVAKALEIDPANLVFETSYLGGGFGRRLFCDFVVPAALTAKAIGRPVKMVMARPDDAQFDCPRSPTVQKIRSVTDESGAMRAYDHACAAGWSTAPIAPAFLADGINGGKVDPFSISGADHWYTAETIRVRTVKNEKVHETFLPGNLRSVAPGYTLWAVETHMDEVANKLGQDPAAFRRSLLNASGRNAGEAPHAVGGAARLREVLDRVVEKSGWAKREDLPEGTGMGIAITAGQERAMPTWIATVAQVRVDRDTGEVTLQHLWASIDAGTLAHPDGALAQAEGALLWGASMAIHEGTEIENGLPRDQNLDTYTPMRMHQVPELHIDFVTNDYMPVGLGEPGVIGVAPAIGNAIFHATGARLRSIPMRPQDVLKALES